MLSRVIQMRNHSIKTTPQSIRARFLDYGFAFARNDTRVCAALMIGKCAALVIGKRAALFNLTRFLRFACGYGRNDMVPARPPN